MTKLLLLSPRFCALSWRRRSRRNKSRNGHCGLKLEKPFGLQIFSHEDFGGRESLVCTKRRNLSGQPEKG